MFRNSLVGGIWSINQRFPNTQSFFLEYLIIMFLGIYGDQFPLYLPECVAHFPLSGNDQIVVVSKLKLSGASFITTPPFSEIIQSIHIFVYTNILYYRIWFVLLNRS